MVAALAVANSPLIAIELVLVTDTAVVSNVALSEGCGVELLTPPQVNPLFHVAPPSKEQITPVAATPQLVLNGESKLTTPKSNTNPGRSLWRRPIRFTHSACQEKKIDDFYCMGSSIHVIMKD